MKKPTARKTGKAPTEPTEPVKPWLFPNVQEWENVQAKKRAATPCDSAESLRVALDALAGLEAASPQPGTIAAILDIAEAACRAIKSLEYEHMGALNAETSRRHYLAELRTSLPPELVPHSFTPASLAELKPYPLAPQKKPFKSDAVRALAPIFVFRILEGDTIHPLGLEAVKGRCPIPDDVRERLRECREGYDLGKWAEAFVSWIIVNFPDSIKPSTGHVVIGENFTVEKGGALLKTKERRAAKTTAKSTLSILRVAATEALEPLLGANKIMKKYNLTS